MCLKLSFQHFILITVRLRMDKGGFLTYFLLLNLIFFTSSVFEATVVVVYIIITPGSCPVNPFMAVRETWCNKLVGLSMSSTSIQA